jgi:diguanylate cyclase (GGDEF)-like protein
MPKGEDKLNGHAQKREVFLTPADYPLDTTLLNIEKNRQSPFRRNGPRFFLRNEEEASDEVFPALLAEANRELANLLRDVRAGSLRDLRSAPESQSISELLMRAVRCATKQFMLQSELGSLALTDELTGLYNRRGFIALAERQMKLGRRSGREMMLFFLDVDGLKKINDSFGHLEGDSLLKRTGEALEMTFRDSDVIARLGGDEFAVLAVEASGQSETAIRSRLHEYLRASSSKKYRYAISLSLGAARFDPRSNTSLGELMSQADQAMYEYKRRRSAPLVPGGAD